MGRKIKVLEDDLHVGDHVEIRFRDGGFDTLLLTGTWLPVRIAGEFKHFYVCTVLPHVNPVRSMGKSREYRCCIDKNALMVGNVVARREVV